MENNQLRGYVGTYTKGGSEGVYTFVLDLNEEKIKDVKPVAKLDNPTYVTVSNDNQYLYAVTKAGGKGGAVAYSIDQETGELTKLNELLTEGSSPCHVSVTRNNETLVNAYYHRGTLESFRLNDDGSLKEFVSVKAHSGSGPNPDRQEKPHVHYTGFTPDEKYVVVCDLGTDQVVTYGVSNSELRDANTLTVRPGSGPRHIEFHPNGKYAYVMTELSNEVIVLQYNSENGSFEELQTIPTLPSDFTENSQGSAIHVSADGRFVYAGNRGHNTIAVFKVDENNGTLSFVEYASSEGDWPRDFEIDPTGQYIVGSNQESGNLVLYRRDQETGKLTVLQSDVKVPYAVCVKFLSK